MKENDIFVRGEPAQRLPFGRALRVRREKLGYTQNDVATKLGITATTITKYEQRSDPPRNRDLLKELSHVYLGTIEELLSGYIPQGFPMHREHAPQPDHTDGPNTKRWDMTDPLDRKARLKVAWESIEENIPIIAQVAPSELWKIVEIVAAAQRGASRYGIRQEHVQSQGQVQEVLEGEFIDPTGLPQTEE